MQVAIIGAGPLGRRLALASSRAGYSVRLEDVMPANLRHAQEYLRQQLGPSALPNVEFVPTIEEAVREADLAIDCVPDELESKLEIFCLLDRMSPPRTVLMTPTTNLSISDLASCTYRGEKCVAVAANIKELALDPGGQWIPKSRKVQLRLPQNASAETIAMARAFWQGLGFDPRIEVDQSV